MMKNNRPNRMSLDISRISVEALKELRVVLENEKFNTRNDFKTTTDLALHITQITLELKERGEVI